MKTQKLLAALLLFASVSLGSFSHALWTDQVLPVDGIPNAISCPSTSKIYLNQDKDADGIADFSLYLNSNFILNGSANNYTAGQILREANGTEYTTVRYYTPLYNMLYKLDANQTPGQIDDYTFWRASWVFPYNTPVRGIATTPNQVVFEQPSDNDANKNTISFLYDYRYKYANGFDGSSNSSYRYNQVPSMNYLLNVGLTWMTLLPGSEGNRKRSRSSVQSISNTTTICKNYELHRCGDGTIDTGDNGYVVLFTGELCDDGPLNGTPGYCALGCGVLAQTERCGDNIVQPAGDPYNGDVNNISFEDCDDGDLTGDNGDGLLNGNDPELNFCTNICLTPFVEAFTEEFVNP
ncbi:MAG: hypothetical protein WC010_02435 [Candidatus Absconditabacterales bacterium]